MNNLHKYLLIFICLCSLQSRAQRNHFSGGYYSSTFICNDNSLYTWGDNYYKQLCRDQTNCSYISPCENDYIENIISINAGIGAHSLALTNNKRVISWGQNYYGELGAGLFCTSGWPLLCEREIPDTVIGGETGQTYLSNVTNIACGQSQSYALLESGKVVAWGDNSFGQLGNGTYTKTAAPTYVRLENGTHLQNIIMIAAGLSHAYALTEDGRVYAWGNNNKYQLACGKTSSQSYPQLVVNSSDEILTNIQSISAGANFGLLLRNDGYVYGIGAFKGSDLNDDNTRIYSVHNYATRISGGETPTFYLENIIAISAGYSHSLAIIKEDNKKYVVAWGDNKFPTISSTHGGQLGNGNTYEKQSLTPKYVYASNNNHVISPSYIYAGAGVSYIEGFDKNRQENLFYVCGTNEYGNLGTNDYFDRYYATRIDQYLCTPMCSGISLGTDTSLCPPFQENLYTDLAPDKHTFSWKKNDTVLLGETTDSLEITNIGTYSVYITDLTESCLPQTSSITISSKEKNFDIIYNSYCTGNLSFKVVGDGDFTWYNKKNGYSLGTGNNLQISKFFTEEIVPDSIYQVWVKHHDDCQSMPVQITKNCDCASPKPIMKDTTACINRHFFAHAQGDSIIWYNDNSLTLPLQIGHIYYPPELNEGTHILYATNILNRCESEVDSLRLNLINCPAFANISGTIETQTDSVPYSLVYLYSHSEHTYIDSCITSTKGAFTLFTQDIDSVSVFAISPLASHFDTWLGDKTNKEYAHYIYADTYISQLKIKLQEKNLTSSHRLYKNKEISSVQKISSHGMILNSYETLESCLENNSNTLYFIRIIYKDNSSELRAIIP
ncbi:MAG: hypothetical protein PF481_03935 [Bacteroidales bacterium]|jgi:alpha-tubulin suppressor-like RCC1 family protein|nr:hypothetical protein [Bacteroidales bacterium]